MDRAMPRMAFSDNYIVRIYRCSRRDAHRFVGTIEEAGKEGKQAFATIEELWNILACKDRERKKPKDGPE